MHRNGIDSTQCCDTSHGPSGRKECWDEYFTYELCCLGAARQLQVDQHTLRIVYRK